MYPVSQEFNEKILSSPRKVYGKLVIDYTNPFLDQSIEIETNEDANVSYPMQTADSVKKPIGKIFSLDGSCELDGSYILAPTEDEYETIQMGWWGNQLSSTNNLFIEPYPTLIVKFTSRPIAKLSVVGDIHRKEYPVDFNINLYNINNELLYTEQVQNNNLVNWQKDIETITQVTKMELVITKWSHPSRQVKIIEFYTSIQEIYDDNEIMSFTVYEETEGIGGSKLPIGTVTSNEVSIVLKNLKGKFDAGNTQSPLYNLLKLNRRIRPWLGVKKDNGLDEMVPMGIFWSGDWDVTDDNIEVRTTGKDRLYFLDEDDFIQEEPLIDISLYDLADIVLIDAGLKFNEYWIDEALKGYIIPYVKLDKQTHKSVLKKIAQACLGQVYCDREGIIRVESSVQISDQYNVDVSESTNISYPLQLTDKVEISDGPYLTLDGLSDLSGSFILAPTEEGPQMGWWGSSIADINGYFEEPYPTATLTFHKKAVSSVLVVGDDKKEEYPVDYIITVYDESNNILAQYNIEDNNSISNITNIEENPTNATKIELKILRWNKGNTFVKIIEFRDVLFKQLIQPRHYFTKNNPAKYSNVANYVEVEYTPYDENGNKLDTQKIIVENSESITENGKRPFKLENNSLIQTEELATEIANKVIGWFGDPRQDLDLDWIGNPAILVGNQIQVQDARELNTYKIVSQEFDYDGGLRTRTIARKVIE